MRRRSTIKQRGGRVPQISANTLSREEVLRSYERTAGDLLTILGRELTDRALTTAGFVIIPREFIPYIRNAGQLIQMSDTAWSALSPEQRQAYVEMAQEFKGVLEVARQEGEEISLRDLVNAYKEVYEELRRVVNEHPELGARAEFLADYLGLFDELASYSNSSYEHVDSWHKVQFYLALKMFAENIRLL